MRKPKYYELEFKIENLQKEAQLRMDLIEALRNTNEMLEKQLVQISESYELKKKELEEAGQKIRILKSDLKHSESKYQSHFENVSEIIYLINRNYRLVNISPSIEKELGFKPENLTQNLLEELSFLTPNTCKSVSSDVMRVFSGEYIPPTEYEFIDSQGKIKNYEVTSSPINENDRVALIIFVARNITDRRQIEEEQLEKQKLKGVIEMARAVGYELNQPIQAIYSHAELMMMDIDKAHPLYEKLSVIKEQVSALSIKIKHLSQMPKYPTEILSTENHWIHWRYEKK